MERELEKLLLSKMSEEERAHYNHFLFCPLSSSNRHDRKVASVAADLYVHRLKGLKTPSANGGVDLESCLGDKANPKLLFYVYGLLEKRGYSNLLPSVEQCHSNLAAVDDNEGSTQENALVVDFIKKHLKSLLVGAYKNGAQRNHYDKQKLRSWFDEHGPTALATGIFSSSVGLTAYGLELIKTAGSMSGGVQIGVIGSLMVFPSLIALISISGHSFNELRYSYGPPPL